MPHIVLVTNSGWSMARHRSEQIRALVARGWRVSAISAYKPDENAMVRSLGADTYRLSCEGAGLNIWKNALYSARMARLLLRLNPDIVHVFSLKAVIAVVPAATLVSVPRLVCTFPGVGVLRQPGNERRRKIIQSACRWMLAGRKMKVIFQNADDLDLFVADGLVSRGKCFHIPGCGVDITELKPHYETRYPPRFVMASRMKWSKGVDTFVKAARLVKDKHPNAEFWLLGGSREDYRYGNEDFVPAAWLKKEASDGAIHWTGRVAPRMAEKIMSEATAVVLLAREDAAEGVPRTLIEAAGLGTPIITTDTPGCKDIVEHRHSGFLCQAYPPSLTVEMAATAMRSLILEPSLASAMGKRGREISTRFDIDRVMTATFSVYEQAGPRMTDKTMGVTQCVD